jgi:predicted N-acetyltransferase YhbS
VRKAAQSKPLIKVSKHDDWTHVFAEVDGKDVSRVYVSKRRIRVGPAGEVRMAGVGGVGTEPAMRGRGIARRVYGQTMREIRRQRYSCTGLFTGSVIVAHRLYRKFGYVDIKVFPQPAKLLDPAALVMKAVTGLAKREPLADWRGTMTVKLRAHPPVHLRLASGEVKALTRAPSAADLSVTLSGIAFAALAWGAVTAEYLLAANEIEWQGSEQARERLLRALSLNRPCIHGY